MRCSSDVCVLLSARVTEGDPPCQRVITPGSFAGSDSIGCQFYHLTVSVGRRLGLMEARTGALCNSLGDRFSKQAGHEYASSFHKQPGEEKKKLDLDETENKQFCHTQAAALTLWVFSARPLLSLQFCFPDVS